MALIKESEIRKYYGLTRYFLKKIFSENEIKPVTNRVYKLDEIEKVLGTLKIR